MHVYLGSSALFAHQFHKALGAAPLRLPAFRVIVRGCNDCRVVHGIHDTCSPCSLPTHQRLALYLRTPRAGQQGVQLCTEFHESKPTNPPHHRTRAGGRLSRRVGKRPYQDTCVSGQPSVGWQQLATHEVRPRLSTEKAAGSELTALMP